MTPKENGAATAPLPNTQTKYSTRRDRRRIAHMHHLCGSAADQDFYWRHHALMLLASWQL